MFVHCSLFKYNTKGREGCRRGEKRKTKDKRLERCLVDKRVRGCRKTSKSRQGERNDSALI